ncbi:hypothetical protein GCM10010145_21950 [Streptomyces ruber]|uniref:Uncharacterized protein n=2 Tax=Streptomyces TaxID=1883 RepID=A0A918EPQ5_9ACTN|nr:hypothetical protein [Streptomyces ruber]GGQ52169.1 hypothetical protein GCM10010145_21950 [Streptomyces ruber]
MTIKGGGRPRTAPGEPAPGVVERGAQPVGLLGGQAAGRPEPRLARGLRVVGKEPVTGAGQRDEEFAPVGRAGVPDDVTAAFEDADHAGQGLGGDEGVATRHDSAAVAAP